MKFLLTIFTLWLTALSLPVQAAPEPATIAIIDFEGRFGYGLRQKVPELLADELINTGKFVVVERSRINAVLAEQGFQTSGMVGDSSLQIGRLLGADFLVTGAIIRAGSSTKTTRAYNVTTNMTTSVVEVSVRVISVQTGQAVFASRKSASAQSHGSQFSSGGGVSLTSLASKVVKKIGRAMNVNPKLVKPVSAESKSAPAMAPPSAMMPPPSMAPAPGVMPPAQLTAPAPTAEPAMHALSIQSDPPGAEVEIDGIFYGNAGGDVKVEAGIHEVHVSLPGHSPWVKKVMVQQDMSFTARLQPVEAE